MSTTSGIIAFVAGIAGMLAFETRASAAVGVAISVTTIPAAAFIGVALAAGRPDGALRGFGVLAVNVLALTAGGVLTLVAQRFAANRRARASRPATNAG
jgi:uncharacterized membrane protein